MPLEITNATVQPAVQLAQAGGQAHKVRQAKVRAEDLPGVKVGVGSKGQNVPPKELIETMEGVNSALAMANSHIKFVVHEASERLMVQVRDNETDEVIKTIPAEELLDLAGKLREMAGDVVGAIIDRLT